MRSFVLVTLGAALVAACGTPQESTEGTDIIPVLTPPGSEAVQPGPNPVGLVAAATLFDEVCTSTSPTFNEAMGKLRGGPYTRNPDTGTFFHRTLDLSFKVVPGQSGACSMVFGSRENGIVAGMAIATRASGEGKAEAISVDPQGGMFTSKAAGGKEFVFRPMQSIPDRTYFSAVLRTP